MGIDPDEIEGSNDVFENHVDPFDGLETCHKQENMRTNRPGKIDVRAQYWTSLHIPAYHKGGSHGSKSIKQISPTQRKHIHDRVICVCKYKQVVVICLLH